MRRCFCILLLACASSLSRGRPEKEPTLAERMASAYDAVQTVSCEIRRRWDSPDGRITMNSRVYWQRPRKLHVDNFSPLRRRYVCDGKNFFYHIRGDERGFSRPVEKLDADWQLRLDVVPGTAMDLLIPLRGIAEVALEGEEAGNGVRRGYVLEDGFAVLHADAQGRLVRYERFARQGDDRPVLEVSYSHFEEVLDGVWIPMRHRTVARGNGRTRVETTQVRHMEVNKPLAERLFVAEPYFEGVRFVDSFEKIYK